MFSVNQTVPEKTLPGKNGMKTLNPCFIFGSGSAMTACFFTRLGGKHVGVRKVRIPAGATRDTLPGNDAVSFLFLLELQ